MFGCAADCVVFERCCLLPLPPSSDSVNNNIRSYTPAGITGTAAVLAGSGHGIVFDALTGTMMFTLYTPGQVLRLDASGGVTIIAGGGALPALTVGVLATSVVLNAIPFATPDSSGGFYFAQQTQRVVSYVNASGYLSRAVGNGSSGTAGDGGPASSATLNSPFCVTIDATAAGYYVCDFSVGMVRYVLLSSGIISTTAGVGTPGVSGDGGPATLAKLSGPVQVRSRRGCDGVRTAPKLSQEQLSLLRASPARSFSTPKLPAHIS